LVHEIKYDGYRLRVERNGDRVRLITRGGYNWSKRYPWIVERGEIGPDLFDAACNMGLFYYFRLWLNRTFPSLG
jgi:hypothetical protein